MIAIRHLYPPEIVYFRLRPNSSPITALFLSAMVQNPQAEELIHKYIVIRTDTLECRIFEAEPPPENGVRLHRDPECRDFMRILLPN